MRLTRDMGQFTDPDDFDLFFDDGQLMTQGFKRDFVRVADSYGRAVFSCNPNQLFQLPGNVFFVPEII